MFGYSDVPLLESAQPVLMGFFPVSFHHWPTGDLFTHRVLLYALHLLFTRLSNQDGIQPSSFGIVAILSLKNRIQLLQNLSTFTPPTALLQYLGCQVEGLNLCFTCYVHRGRCMACVAKLLPKTLLTTSGAFHLSGDMWAVREEVHSFSVTPVSCVTKRVENIMPALQAYHARARENCNALPLRTCKNEAPLLICSWYKAVQHSMDLPYPTTSFGCFFCGSATKFRADLFDF